jgi:ribose transport system substrate-binding protein
LAISRTLRPRLGLVLAVALAAASTSGCRGRSAKVVAVIPKSTAHVFWVSVEAGARAAAADYGLELVWNGPPTESDIARQIQILDSMVARRVDGIAIAACERKALVDPVERAVAAGIPVTVVDSGIDSTRYMSFIATDNVEAGRIAARALAEMLAGRGKVAMILHAPGSFSTMDREQGFEEVMAREFPGISIVARQFAMSDRARAMAAAENILTAHPDLGGLFASTEPSASGIALALKSRGLAGRIRFVGFDWSEAMLEDLRTGVLDAIVVQDPFRMGFEAVKSLAEKIEGRQPPKRLDLPARLVRAADLELPEVKALLAPDPRKRRHP